MVELILGKSGSGKTKYLIDAANLEKSRGNGNIVFIDTDDTHIFSLDYAIRLINANKFAINNFDSLYGFVAGIVSRDYDIEKIYLDGLYEIINFDEGDIVNLIERLNELSKACEVDFYIGLNMDQENLPEGLDVEIKVL